MEPKKNPNADVHSKRGIIFNISLVLSLLIVITAFKWSVPIRNQYQPKELKEESEIFYKVAITSHDAKPVKAKRATQSKPSSPNFVAAKNPPTEEFKGLELDEPTDDSITVVAPDVAREVVPDVHDIVEKMPEPEGGLEGFYRTLKNNLKYPVKARRMITEGRVFVQFVIDEKGNLTDFKVLKGIGNGCDEEAVRVLALTKWKAGKQRGVAVKVRMVQPIYFSLEQR
jgi:periplasmic protein TonB